MGNIALYSAHPTQAVLFLITRVLLALLWWQLLTFTMVDIGDFGRQNDSSIFNTSPFGKALNRGFLNTPDEGQLPNTTQKARFCFISISIERQFVTFISR